ncbi:hypothetical protein A2803_03510 [Candidatus Woesebacteria bacterium RIFCSPHIGHO2_01_FULL_44_21]|uniref:LysM domain-containing protein n=1 Tax=Candidatus Woesebacteria bacterium RIFCSPHIGHO2_01_FULL_44_21 TaxID=1802503 RepID=A0A1F7YYS5_9BACT|nr:MAG: hypothetical protein A2803_03510 [Candidatus Woesebacteria bacterium RIFCSPHIGHO2_01_FULL_44_21]OGM69104.1 MAG: hypothetical protein A2897_04730 [Candidatus Woesebacteria bacterium RIFCSPLOWO2_01_FULL_44_24b]
MVVATLSVGLLPAMAWDGHVDVSYSCDGGLTYYEASASSSWPGFQVDWGGDSHRGSLSEGESASGTAVFFWPEVGHHFTASWSAEFQVECQSEEPNHPPRRTVVHHNNRPRPFNTMCVLNNPDGLFSSGGVEGLNGAFWTYQNDGGYEGNLVVANINWRTSDGTSFVLAGDPSGNSTQARVVDLDNANPWSRCELVQPESQGQGGGPANLPEIQDWWWDVVYTKEEAELIYLRVSNIFEDERDPAFCWEHAPEKPPAWVRVRIMNGEELIMSFEPTFIETERRPNNISCWEWEYNLLPDWHVLYDAQFVGVPLITERVDISYRGMEKPAAGWWNVHEEGLALYPGDDESLLSAEMNFALNIESEEVAKVEAEETVEYTVVPTDTLSGICAQFGANQIYGQSGCIEQVKLLNGLEGSMITVGQVLIVPQS